MTSNRNISQRYIENKVGCLELSKWSSYKQKVIDLVLDENDERKLKEAVRGDAVSYYKKGLISFCEAVNGISNQRYSWAVVKLYYSVFYFLRSDILLADYLIVRCSSVFFTRVKNGEMLEKFNSKNRGDHQLTIEFLSKLHKEGKHIDFIQDMEIEGESPYVWMMKQRERINYQSRDFSDPTAQDILVKPASYFVRNADQELFELYKNDTYGLYCSDLDHACLAIPYNKIKYLSKTFNNLGIEVNIPESLEKHLEKLIKLSRIFN